MLTPGPHRPTVDHVIPLFRGGGRGPANKVWACASCNQLKGAHLPCEFACLPALERMPRSRRERIRARCDGIRGADRGGNPWPALPEYLTFASRMGHHPILLCEALPPESLLRLRAAGLLTALEAVG
jgi:hypothetical protein